MTYLAYRDLISQLMAEKKTTGNDQSEEMVHYADLNIHRMNRLDKTTELLAMWNPLFEKMTEKVKWVVLTEGWCGDAAQILPVINKIAEASNGKVDLEVLLRDENLELMDKYLTNGGRAIPKLICYNQAGKELYNWGPRPKGAQLLIDDMKAKGIEMEKIKIDLQLWYTHNKTVEIQHEIFGMFALGNN